MKLTDLMEPLLQALYPENCTCALCDREAVIGADRLCDTCRPQVRTADAPEYPEPLSGLTAAFLYEGPVREAIHRFKFSGGTWLAPYFAKRIPLPEARIDLVIPVPLHPSRRRERGYNQSELLAKYLLPRLPGAALDTSSLTRARKTAAQAGLGGRERRSNLKGAFRCSDEVTGKTVLLIDDVATTRSTLKACAEALQAAGAAAVYAACACVTDLQKDPGDNGAEAAPAGEL